MKTIDDALKALNIKIIDNNSINKQFYDEQYGVLDGMRGGKTFYRFKNEVLQSLIAELHTNFDCAYKTYANNVIKEGFIPKHISCMVKQLQYYEVPGVENTRTENEAGTNELYTYKEVLSSQILNYYGCPTVYNLPLKTKNFKGEDEYKIISADFMQEGQTFLTFDEYDCPIGNGMGYLEDSVKKIQNKILNKIVVVDDAEKEKFIEDFIMTYLVRKYVLTDFDFYHTNIGVLIDSDNRKLSLINFDYEQTFLDVVRSISTIKKDLEYVRKNRPMIYKKFVQLTDMLLQALSSIPLKKPTYEIESTKDYVYRNLKENLDKVNTAIAEMSDLPNQ